MLFIIGAIVVAGCVLSGYVLHGGNLAVLWQPTEILIIGGAAVGSFVIANPLHTIKEVGKAVVGQLTGAGYNKKFYMDLLSLMYEIFDKSRKQGVMSIEEDIDDPQNSQIFTRYPAVMKDKVLLAFVCDYLRIISSGNMASHELEGMMENEIESRLHELEEPAHAVNAIADALPGLGIVAAVLGIVITMNFLTEGPERIGQSVAAALVGTFLGIWMGYGFVGPLSNSMGHTARSKIKAYECVKSSLIATVGGQAPQMAIEFGRKALPSDERPGFQELNDHVKSK